MGDPLDTFNALADDDDLVNGLGISNGNNCVGYNSTMTIGNVGWSDPMLNTDPDKHTVRISKADLILENEDGTEVNVNEVLNTISERLCVLSPNFEAMEEYPALKDAYKQYKMLEKLLLDNNKPKG